LSPRAEFSCSFELSESCCLAAKALRFFLSFYLALLAACSGFDFEPLGARFLNKLSSKITLHLILNFLCHSSNFLSLLTLPFQLFLLLPSKSSQPKKKKKISKKYFYFYIIFSIKPKKSALYFIFFV
jgi:hypothetical protein